MTISEHYCGQDLISIGLFSEHEPCCEDPNCCHNEFATYEIEDEFSASSNNFDFTQLELDLPGLVEYYQVYMLKDVKGQNLAFNLPPPKNHPYLTSLQSFLL
jgi:hypothetical protein